MIILTQKEIDSTHSCKAVLFSRRDLLKFKMISYHHISQKTAGKENRFYHLLGIVASSSPLHSLPVHILQYIPGTFHSFLTILFSCHVTHSLTHQPQCPQPSPHLTPSRSRTLTSPRPLLFQTLTLQPLSHSLSPLTSFIFSSFTSHFPLRFHPFLISCLSFQSLPSILPLSPPSSVSPTGLFLPTSYLSRFSPSLPLLYPHLFSPLYTLVPPTLTCHPHPYSPHLTRYHQPTFPSPCPHFSLSAFIPHLT